MILGPRQGSVRVIEYRAFRNTDPPAITAIWNECFIGRGAYRVPSVAFLERSIFSRPYFDRQGLLIASDGRVPVGFVHAGFGPKADMTALDTKTGVVCALAVRPGNRRQGIGKALLDRAERYLEEHGATEVFAGPAPPNTPFYFGLYGGSDLPGVLDSDTLAAPFLRRRGYQPGARHSVFQRRLDVPITVNDARMMDHRKSYNITVQQRSGLDHWWQESVIGLIEPVEFRLEDRNARCHVGRAVLWDMDGFSQRWGTPSAGIVGLTISPEHRRKGLGKFFFGHLLRHLHEQCFGICECQIDSTNAAAAGLLASLGFTQVDSGTTFRKATLV